jgi:hypothetical protein
MLGLKLIKNNSDQLILRRIQPEKKDTPGSAILRSAEIVNKAAWHFSAIAGSITGTLVC